MWASTYHTLCYNEMWVSPKIRVWPSGTLSQTQDFENFATASRTRCQQHSSSSSSTVEFVDDTIYDDRRVVAVYYKSIYCNPLTPLVYCDLLWICCTTCFYSWQDSDWHSASRGPSAVAEFFVLHTYSLITQCDIELYTIITIIIIFICPIIQQYAHLHQYKSRPARSDKNTDSWPKTSNNTVTGYIFYHTSKILQTNKKTRKKSTFSMLLLKHLKIKSLVSVLCEKRRCTSCTNLQLR